MTEHQSNPSPGFTAPHDDGAPDTTQTMAPDTTLTPDLAPLMAPDVTQTLAVDTQQTTARITPQDIYADATLPWFRRKRYAFPSAVLLVFLVIMVSTGGNDPGIIDRTRTAAELRADLENSVKTGTIGQSVRDGKFAFVVTSLEKPGKTITNRLGSTETAQGVFVIVRVDVTNIGYDARTLTSTDQFLVGDQGQRFATSGATSSLPGDETIFLEKVNPGHTVNNAPMLFDVPPGVSIAGIELHGSVSSTGVKVTLS